LREAIKKSREASKKYLYCPKPARPAKTRKSKKREKPRAPATASFVAFTGSVTELKTKNKQVKGVPIKRMEDVVFSAALLNMC
jgi:hypothetical protein